MAYRIDFDKLKTSQPLYAPERQQQSSQELEDGLFVGAPVSTPAVGFDPEVSDPSLKWKAAQYTPPAEPELFTPEGGFIGPMGGSGLWERGDLKKAAFQALTVPYNMGFRGGPETDFVVTDTPAPAFTREDMRQYQESMRPVSPLGKGLGFVAEQAALLPFVGIGYGTTGRLAGTAAKALMRGSKAAPWAAAAARGAGAGFPFGTFEALGEGESVPDALKSGLETAALFSAFDVGGKLVGAAIKAMRRPRLVDAAEKFVEEGKDIAEDGLLRDNPRLFRKYSLYDSEQAAMSRLNEGIEAAQNYVRHNDILAAYPPGTTVEKALADIRKNTGVDLPALIADVEAAQERGGLRQQMTEGAKSGRLGRAAGAVEVQGLKRGAAAPSELKMNAARAVLKGTESPAVANRIFDEFPQLKGEFPEQVKMVDATKPADQALPLGVGAMRRMLSDQKAVDAFVDDAITNRGKYKTLPLRQVTPGEAEIIKKLIGNDVSGYTHELNSNDLRHAINRHGNVQTEAKRGQLPITDKDLKAIPEIINNPDKILPGSRGGYDIIYQKKVNGVVYYVEVTSKNRKVLSSKTMWKKPSVADRGSDIPAPPYTSETERSLTSSDSSIRPRQGAVNKEPAGTPESMNQVGSKLFGAAGSDSSIIPEKADVNQMLKRPTPATRGGKPPLVSTSENGRTLTSSDSSIKPRWGDVNKEPAGSPGFPGPQGQRLPAQQAPNLPVLNSGVLETQGSKADRPTAGSDSSIKPVQTAVNKVLDTIKRREIVKFLDKEFAPIRVGRFRGRNVLGIFKIRPEVIRSKLANDIPTISHEVGHFLDKRLGLADPAFDAELMAMGRRTSMRNYTPDQVRKEGVAEFMRLYLTDEKTARIVAPKYYAAFEQRVAAHPDIHDSLLTARRDIFTWNNQPAEARVLGSINIGEKDRRKMSLDSLYSMTIDEIHPIKRFVEEVGATGLPIGKDPYKLAWLLRGWTGKAETLLKRGVLDEGGNKAGKSLDEILKPVEKELDSFRAYATSKHSLEVTVRGKHTGVLDADAQEVVSKYAARYQPVLDELVKYQDAVLDQLVDAGVMDAGAVAKMRQMYPNYVPFYRHFDDMSAAGEYLSKGGFANLRNPVKEMKGSARDINDPIESIVKNTYLYTNIAERNRVGRAIVELAEGKEGLGRLVEKVEGGRSGKENVLTVFRNGKAEHYQVDPDLYRATLALDRESANIIVKLLSYPASWLRAGAVLSPDFMVRNPVRDQFSAFINSKYGFVPGIDLLRGVFHAFKKDDLYWQWMNSGGAHSTMVSLDRDYLQKSLRQMLNKSTKDKIKTVVNPKTYLEMLRTLSEFGEQGTRLGEFAKGIRSGSSPLEAALSSRDVTLDFSRVGTHTKGANRAIAFFNATVQGMDKMRRQFIENPKGAIMKTALSVTLPSVLLYFHNRDNPLYQELPQWEKDLFWIIPTGNTKEDHIYRIPKPFELGILFGTTFERALAWMDSQDPKAFKDFGKTIAEAAMPGYIPTAFLPVIEVWGNKSYFTGRPIVPQREEKLEPNQQFGPRTTEFAKLLARGGKYVPFVGEHLGSPRKVETILRGYTGGLGMYTVQGAEALGDAAGAMERTPRPTLDIAEYPVLKAFMAKPYAGGQSMQDFYEELDRLERQYNTAKQTKSPPPADFNMERLQALRKVDNTLQEMRKQERAILKSETLSPDQKQAMLKKLDMAMLNLARRTQKKEAV